MHIYEPFVLFILTGIMGIWRCGFLRLCCFCCWWPS